MSLDAIVLDLGNVLAFHDNQKLMANLAQTFHTEAALVEHAFEAGLWDPINRGHFAGDLLRIEFTKRFRHDVDSRVWNEVWNSHFTINEPMAAVVSFLVGQVKLVLLSNTHHQHFEHLRQRLPVLKQFDGLVLSYEVGALKPERAIYKKALSATGAAPWKTVFFDDVKAYAAAATQVGMHGRVFTTVEQFTEDLAKLGFSAK
jgi:FMN phosphatase YigB (HAD superfamily)